MTNVDGDHADDKFRNMALEMNVRSLVTCAIASALFVLVGCSTPETRINERPEVYRSLSPNDQALVSQGKIREGMSRDAVYLAWGAPNQRGEGRNRGKSVESWIYFSTTTTGYYSGGFGNGYGYGYGLGFGGYAGSYVGRGRGGHLHRRSYIYYDPFYDPFFWRNNSIVSYPDRTVSFENGRVIAYQYLPTPRIY